MFRRRMSAALALGAALATITACSSTATGTATPTVATDTMPAPNQVLDVVKQAALAASAVHIKGTVTDSGSTFAVDMQLDKTGDAQGSIVEGGTTIPLVVANKVYYIQFTKTLMSSNGIDPSGTAGTLLLNKWVSSTSKMLAGTDMVTGMKPMADYTTFMNGVLDQPKGGTLKTAGNGTVNGTAVAFYTDADGGKIAVATGSPHYMMQVEAPKSSGAGELDFTGWNQPVKISAPPAAEIYSGPGS